MRTEGREELHLNPMTARFRFKITMHINEIRELLKESRDHE